MLYILPLVSLVLAVGGYAALGALGPIVVLGLGGSAGVLVLLRRVLRRRR